MHFRFSAFLVGMLSLPPLECHAVEPAQTYLREWVKDQKETCAPNKTIFKKGHVVERDINGDGIKDYILDVGYLECDGQFVAFCGTGGCYKTIIASVPGGYVKAFNGLVRDATFKIVRGRPAMKVTLHGMACGKAGVYNCYETYYWDGRTFGGR